MPGAKKCFSSTQGSLWRLWRKPLIGMSSVVPLYVRAPKNPQHIQCARHGRNSKYELAGMVENNRKSFRSSQSLKGKLHHARLTQTDVWTEMTWKKARYILGLIHFIQVFLSGNKMTNYLYLCGCVFYASSVLSLWQTQMQRMFGSGEWLKEGKKMRNVWRAEEFAKPWRPGEALVTASNKHGHSRDRQSREIEAKSTADKNNKVGGRRARIKSWGWEGTTWLRDDGGKS